MNKISRIFVIILVLITLTLSLVFCGGEEEDKDGKLNVVTTTGQIWDTVRIIGGDKINVINILGPGIDPHTYNPTESDISLISNAELILWNGLHLEAHFPKVLENMPNAIKITEDVPRSMLISTSEDVSTSEYDPHIWNDLSIWMLVTKKIRDTLIEYDPENENIYQDNAEELLKNIEKMDNYIKSEIAKIPEGNRSIITSHDAFNYYGKRYGLEMLGIQGISSASEAGTKDIQDLAKLIVNKNIPAVFIETSVSPKLIYALIESVKSKGHKLVIGGELYSDSLGKPGTIEGTYLGMLEHNTDIIVEALTE